MLFYHLLWVQYCRRKQAGVYTSYTFGPVDRQIKVSKLMNLDTLLILYFFHIGDCKQTFSGQVLCVCVCTSLVSASCFW